MSVANKGNMKAILTENANHNPKLTSGFKFYPALRDALVKYPDLWIKGKRISDQEWPYWRVHDKLYDLTEFIKKHPGGTLWIEKTQGMDITESFESSHFGESIYHLLEKYYVKDAETPRNSPFTFKPNGFYMSLKRKVTPIILKEGKRPNLKSLIIHDGNLAVFLLVFFIAGWTNSVFGAVIAGILLGMVSFIAHNFIHLRDNWRMYVYDTTIVLSSYEWRIMHALSHHTFPNTIYDYEAELMEPYIYLIPNPKNGLLYNITMIPKIILLWTVVIFLQYFAKVFGNLIILRSKFRYAYLIPISQMMALVILTGSVKSGCWLWYVMQVSAFIYESIVGLTGGHHHAKIYHEGDSLPEKPDWGIFQLLTVAERDLVNNSDFLTAIAFGYHILHHLFPTVDHMKLSLLKGPLKETCEEFGVNLKIWSIRELTKGTYLHFINHQPNKNMPENLKMYNIQ